MKRSEQSDSSDSEDELSKISIVEIDQSTGERRLLNIDLIGPRSELETCMNERKVRMPVTPPSPLTDEERKKLAEEYRRADEEWARQMRERPPLFEDLAMEMLGIEALPSGSMFNSFDPGWKHVEDEVFFSQADYTALYCEVAKWVPGISMEHWKNARQGDRYAMLEAALNARAEKVQVDLPADGTRFKEEEVPAAFKEGGNRRKGVNGKMLDKMQKDPTCHGWTAKEWAEYCRCKPPSVVITQTWKALAETREKLRAERARDRRGRGTGRRRGDFGPAV